MKLQSLTIIFIIIILPVILVLSSYIGYEIKTINMQNMYNSGVMQATHDAIFSFELNTKNDDYSNNPEAKRSNIKAAVKTFENSLSTTCNLGLYNNEAVEEYIPAIVFGLYDGFYMYSPSELITTKDDGTQETTYKHNLRNYVYYSEKIEGTDIVIRYSLDNYVVVSGTLKTSASDSYKYQTIAGYLLAGTWNESDEQYNGLDIKEETLTYKVLNNSNEPQGTTETNVLDAQKYYKSASEFTKKFNYIINRELSNPTLKDILIITSTNDPENVDSAFVQHKREIIKNKVQGVLNSSITAYANRTNTNYKMPKFSEEEWEKIYSNISVISFVQGMDLGFKNYNGYCILNSTNSQEYVNSNLMYFIDANGNYHDIRCSSINKSGAITGYKIGDFETTKYEEELIDAATGEVKVDASGNPITKTKYYYKHDEYACYGCVNGSLETNKNVYDYVTTTTDSKIKSAYYTSLARERYRTTKLQDDTYNTPSEDTGVAMCEVIYHYQNGSDDYTDKLVKGTSLEEPAEPSYVDHKFLGWYNAPSGGNQYGFPLTIDEDKHLYAQWIELHTVKFIGVDPELDGITEDIVISGIEHGKTLNDTNIEDLAGTAIKEKIKAIESLPGFVKWEVKNSGTIFFRTQNITENLEIIPVIKKMFNVEFYMDNSFSDLYHKESILEGDKLDKPTEPTKPGYKFDGWYNKETGTKYTGFGSTISKNLTLYATWKPVYTVTFYRNDGTNTIEGTHENVAKNSTVTSITPKNRTGYNFAGWYSNSACTGSTFNFNTKINSDVNLYAKWETNKYTVTFDSKGGSAVAKQTVEYGGCATRPENPVKSKYGFKGWYTDTAYTKEFDFNTPITENTELYAKWENTYTVTFYRNDGTNTIEGTHENVAKNSTVTSITPKNRTGYNFAGWYSNSACTGSTFNFNTKINSDVNLYAKWIQVVTVKITKTSEQWAAIGDNIKKLDFNFNVNYIKVSGEYKYKVFWISGTEDKTKVAEAMYIADKEANLVKSITIDEQPAVLWAFGGRLFTKITYIECKVNGKTYYISDSNGLSTGTTYTLQQK